MAKHNEKLFGAAYMVAVFAMVSLALTALYATLRISAHMVSSLFNNKPFHVTDLAMVMVIVGFTSAAVYVRADWKSRHMYIMVEEHHFGVDPVNRRDEFEAA